MGVWLVLKTPLFRFQTLEITGNKIVNQNDITSLLWSRVISDPYRPVKALLGFSNFLVWPNNFSSRDLSLIPHLKGLNITKDYRNHTLKVAVEERSPAGIWCFQAQTNAERTQNNADEIPRQSASSPRESAPCWWFDDQGIVFSQAPDAQGGLISVVHDYSQPKAGLLARAVSLNFVSNILSVFKTLKASGLGIKEVRLEDIALQEVEVDSVGGLPAGKAGPKLYFSLRFPALNDLAVIQSLMSKPGFNNLEYLDFRVENRAYYK